MTTKHLSGAYPDGYALNAKYTGLVIDHSATVGGTGVSAAFNATIQNYGLVNASGERGIYLVDGGRIVNGSPGDTTALIGGNFGVEAYGASTTIVNFGTIHGRNDTGVNLQAGGNVTNGSATDTTALITGNFGVIDVGAIASGAIANFGTIQGTDVFGSGVVLNAPGTVTNGSVTDTTALIEGYRSGVYFQGPSATVINFGTIRGTAIGAVQLGLASDVLVAEAGSKFLGQVLGAGGTLELAGGAGTITGLGATGTLSGAVTATFSGFGGYSIDAGGAWTLAGASTLAAGQFLNVKGHLTNAGTVSGAGAVEGAGSLVNSAGSVIDADAAGGLVLGMAGATIANAGLIEGTGVGGLIIRSTSVSSSNGGVILVGNGSNIALQGADLIGGTLESAGTGEIKTFLGGPNLLDGTAFAVSNQAVVVVQNSTALTIQGAIVNADRIALTSSGAATKLTIGSAGATLSGGGAVIMTNSADNIITGASSAAILTNVANTIDGAGQLGAGSLTLINESKGVIVGPFSTALVIDTGANTIVNAGLILARGSGGVTIQSAVANSGLLETAGGVLTVNGAVSGAGEGVIAGGTLDFASSFNQKVVFRASSGVLELAHSRSYTGSITGFSKTGGTSLDLNDIAFGGSTKATFSGTATSGVLTVTDGTHTAKITLIGDYRTSAFVAASDGHGGTTIHDPIKANGVSAPPHQFIAAMAGLGVPAGGAIHTGNAWAAHEPVLVRPQTMTA